jgi:peptidylprolyl isomerase
VANAKSGDTVHIHYTGRLEDGTVFDSSQGREPLRFTLGEGQVIKGFEQAVEGLEVGEKTSTSIPPELGYGERMEKLVMRLGRDQLPPGLDTEVGQQLEMTTQDGQKIPVAVTDLTDESIELDANHPLAGRTLNFELELVAIG